MLTNDLLLLIVAANFILLIVLFVAVVRKYSSILTILRTKHVLTWAELGRPSLISNNSMANGIAMLDFLMKKRFMTLNDVPLVSICVAYVSLLKVYFALFIIEFLLVIALIKI